MNEPKLTLDQAKEIVATKTAPKITEQSIKDKIERVHYIEHDRLTICIITMFNGFDVVGVSKSASAANHDSEVGKRYAFDNAFKQLWQLEGYRLRTELAAAGQS
jgi:benzoyl-CoA reductase/2-hydroxyglutaryl-CoA dehydratase subunit BcrC/BadD/HgdB